MTFLQIFTLYLIKISSDSPDPTPPIPPSQYALCPGQNSFLLFKVDSPPPHTHFFLCVQVTCVKVYIFTCTKEGTHVCRCMRTCQYVYVKARGWLSLGVFSMTLYFVRQGTWINWECVHWANLSSVPSECLCHLSSASITGELPCHSWPLCGC